MAGSDSKAVIAWQCHHAYQYQNALTLTFTAWNLKSLFFVKMKKNPG
jgi:hypothetical protein